jgi:hypothetical protein
MKRDHATDCRKAINRFLVILPAVLTFTYTTCSSSNISIDTWHAPLYDATIHQTTIYATVVSPDGVQSVEIKITHGKLVDRLNASDPPSAIPLRKNAVTFTKTFTYPSKLTTVDAAYSQDFGDQALVSYQVKTVSWSNKSTESEEITFAAGYPQEVGFAFAPTDIRPVYWHRGGDMDTKIDVCFYPDKDYKGMYTSFTDDMNKIVKYAFFDTDSANTVSTVYGRDFRHFWNLWAAPFGADKDSICRLCAPNVKVIQAIVDGGAILHCTDGNYRDKATVGLGGFGSVKSPSAFGTPPDVLSSVCVFMHESGHFLHGFGDEYCCDGGYYTNGAQYPNLYKSQSACIAAASQSGFDVSQVDQIGQLGVWHLNQADEIMGNTLKYGYGKYQFYHFCDQSVQYRYAKCISGNCY